MIQPRQDGELRYGDICLWTASGQEVTVLDDFDAKLVKVAVNGVVKYVPRRHLTLRTTAAENLEFYDDWFEEADQL